MEEIKLASELLTRILDNDETFRDVMRDVHGKKEHKKEVAMNASSLLGSELRHHLFLSKMISTLTLTNEHKYLLLIALANNFYLRKLDRKEVNAYIKKELGEEYTPEIEKLINHEGELIEAFPGEHNFRDDEIVPARFNVPPYLFKMWQKHYGKGLTYKFLKKNIKPAVQYLRVNLGKISPNALLQKNPEFKKADFEDFVLYTGKKSLRKLDEYTNYEVFNEKVGLKTVIDEVWANNMQYVAVYSGDDDSLVRECLMRTRGKVGLSVALPKFENRVELVRLQRLEKPKNLNLFEAYDLGLMDAAITNKQDLIIVMPESSSFDRIRQYPDYLLHFKQASFDSLIVNELAALNSFAKYLDDEGKLVYIVDTLNKKESVGIINAFLNEHKDFKLTKWHQKFPHEEEDTTLFYAVLEKKTIEEDA